MLAQIKVSDKKKFRLCSLIARASQIKGELVVSKNSFSLATHKKIYRQFVKFSIVGLVNTFVDWFSFIW